VISIAEKSMINDMTTGSVARQLLKFAVPLMLSNALQMIYNVVDMIVIGQFVGSAGISAVASGGDLMHLCTTVGMGFGTAGQIVIAQHVGSGNRKALSHDIGTFSTFLLGISLVITAVMLLLSRPILHLMQVPAEAFSQALDYTVVCYCGMFFIFGYNIVSSILRGMGDGRRPLIFIGLASVLNIVLDLVLVAALHMDALGAALATVASQGLSFIVSVIYLYLRREQFGFDFKLRSFAIKKESLRPLVKLGLPLTLQQLAICTSMLVIRGMVNSYGVVISAVTAVGDKLRSILSLITFALGAAASTMIGQNMGAGKPDRVRSVVRMSLLICLVMSVVCTVIFMAFPQPLFSLFDRDPAVLAWANRYMIVVCISLFSYSTMNCMNALISGVGSARLSLVIALIDGVAARVLFAVLLGNVLGFGIMGIWIGNALAPFTTAILGGLYYLSGKWQTKKLLIE